MTQSLNFRPFLKIYSNIFSLYLSPNKYLNIFDNNFNVQIQIIIQVYFKYFPSQMLLFEYFPQTECETESE